MWRTWRITEIWQKVLYVLVGYAAIALFFLALRTWLLDQHAWPYALIAFVVNTAFTIAGIRIFRGYLEPVQPSRAWWRWTGRPKAGFWLSALHIIGGIGAIQEFWPHSQLPSEAPAAALNILSSAVAGLGYLNSSFRLCRHPELWSQRRREPTADTTTP
jgi:hypothetical protein